MKHIKHKFPERYYIGVELEGGIDYEQLHKVNQLWHDFMNDDLKLIGDVDLTMNFIGLECYPPDFMESKIFDYFALVQTKALIHRDGFVTKKLPAGTYISFVVEFDQLHDQIQHVYEYINEHKVPVHMGFDYEDYLQGEDYSKPGAKLHFTFLLDHE